MNVRKHNREPMSKLLIRNITMLGIEKIILTVSKMSLKKGYNFKGSSILNQFNNAFSLNDYLTITREKRRDHHQRYQPPKVTLFDILSFFKFVFFLIFNIFFLLFCFVFCFDLFDFIST